MYNIDVSIKNKVAYVTFFSDKANSLNSKQLEELTMAFENISNDENINIAVLKSEGKVFCSGASFDELLQVEDINTAITFFLGFQKLISSMISCNKPIIGLIQGKTIGGGVGIIAACDYVIASHELQLRLSEINIGIGPFVIEPVISTKIGIAKTSELSWSPNEWFDSQWAYQSGLINKIVDLDNLLQIGIDKANELAVLNSESLKELKNVFWSNKEKLIHEMKNRAFISGKLILKEFAKNKLMSFKKKS